MGYSKNTTECYTSTDKTEASFFNIKKKWRESEQVLNCFTFCWGIWPVTSNNFNISYMEGPYGNVPVLTYISLQHYVLYQLCCTSCMYTLPRYNCRYCTMDAGADTDLFTGGHKLLTAHVVETFLYFHKVYYKYKCSINIMQISLILILS